MTKSILILHAMDDEHIRADELAACIGRTGSAVVLKDLREGDYDGILDAVAACDIVVYWPADSIN